ncbi:MAG: ferritin-like domain-containing protein [Tepidanaerobacteraceae bacterium]
MPFSYITISNGYNNVRLRKGVISLVDDRKLIGELNKILTLEHGHLGMYENYPDYKDKDIRRTFRRFMEIEIEHINKLKNTIRNLGGKPFAIVESGNIIGRMLGITIQVSDIKNTLGSYSLIEKKSFEGYSKFVLDLEEDAEKRNQFIAEIAVSNMLEADLMHLWLKDKLKTMR